MSEMEPSVSAMAQGVFSLVGIHTDMNTLTPSLKLITEASDYPVLLADIKEHLAIDGTDHDDRLTTYLISAVDFIENETGRSLTTQTWDMTLPLFPKGITVPKPPLASVTHVKYYDETNTQQTLSSSLYYVVTSSTDCGFIAAKTSWPATYRRPDAVTVRFVTGEETIPAIVPHAIKLIVGWMNENREGQAKDIQGIDRLICQLRDGRYA